MDAEFNIDRYDAISEKYLCKIKFYKRKDHMNIIIGVLTYCQPLYFVIIQMFDLGAKT